MRNGFKFKGRHSSELGVTVRTKSRPIRPSVKSLIVDVPFRDGVYDFSESNPLGRAMYNYRIFTVVINVCAENIYEMQDKLSKLSLWLEGSGDLVFDDMPLTVWKGKISDEIVYMPEYGGKKAVMEVSFRTEPFSFGAFGTEGPVLDIDVISLDDYLPVGMDELYTYTVSKTGELHILNFGDRPMRPVINISGANAAVVMQMNGKSLNFFSKGNTKVDFERQDVTDEDGRLNVAGEFFEFSPGENILKVRTSNDTEIILTVSFKPKFIYGAVFDDVEWGVNHA